MKSLKYYFIRIKDRYANHYFPVFKQKPYPEDCYKETELANKLILDLLQTGKPCLISRFGSNELYATISIYKRTSSFWDATQNLSFLGVTSG